MDYLTLTVMVLLLALLPLIVINVYILTYDKQSKIFKIILLSVSLLFGIFYFYVIRIYQNKPMAFKPDEFGILLIDNVSDNTEIQLDYKSLKKLLDNIKLEDHNVPMKSVRVIIVKADNEFFNDPYVMKSFVFKQLAEYNGSLAVLFNHVFGPSIQSTALLANRIVQQGFPKDTFQFDALPSKLPEILKRNIEPIIFFKKDEQTFTEVDTTNLVSSVNRIIISNHYYDKGTEILKKAIDIRNSSLDKRLQIQFAEKELKRAIELDSTSDKSYALLGYIKSFEENKFDVAAVYYQKAKEIEPESYSHTLNLAQTYYFGGRKQDAIQLLKDYLDKYEGIIQDDIKMYMRGLLKSYERKE